ncbi:MAG: hypothetical protein GC203_18390 [Phenylobacterium sp.]|uniref:M56 family metallopeptidase n=1 Tax=Phenylobacterium sp. TaxID=1871053 RepID=UPI0025D77361|nr:M56 family metallopeptidase [Phenylobacterium sp.]MBI1199833.1 hypothetical protein [Phenylobacterium sp.]
MTDVLYAAFGPAPAASLAAACLYANVTASTATLAVALARPPARKVFGAEAAYALWVVPPIVAFLTLLAVMVPVDSDRYSTAAATAIRWPALGPAAIVWAVGAIAMAVAFAVAQHRFMAQVRAGRGGPAVVGLIWPRIVLPADDDGYTAEERDLIRAHERAHVARRDPRAAALVSLAQCVCWFNPVMHLGAYLLRLDQEVACDAAVTMRRPWARALYARTLLKTQLGGAPLPFACCLRPWGQHPLEVRIALLKRRTGPASSAPRPTGASIVSAGVDVIRP